MSYLYGDSTPSTLQVNFIEFLRDSIDFSLELLLADQRVVEAQARLLTRERAATLGIERLEKLGPTVARTIKSQPDEDPDSPSGRCVAAILRSVDDLVRAEVANVRATLGEASAMLAGEAAEERKRCLKALEALLVKHDPPSATLVQHLVASGGQRYACRTRLTTEFGLEATMELEVPAGHLLSQVVRVDQVMERLQVQAPEVGGWLHKETKLKAQRLEKHYITEISIGPAESTLKLRAAPEGASPGFDLTFRDEAPRVLLARVEERDTAAAPPFEVAEDDAKKLLATRDKLAEAVAELNRHRKAVISAAFESAPLGTSDQAPLLVTRLVATIAPVVQEIAARSLSRGELVLRRLLGDDRREEIFVSKADLVRKLESLSDAKRRLFDPLWAEGSGQPASRPPLFSPPTATRNPPPLASPPLRPVPSPPHDQTLREPLPSFEPAPADAGGDPG